MHPVDMLLPIVIILVAARAAGALSRRIGMPAVLGELLVGLILGPSVLGLVQINDTLEMVGYIGVLILMFIAGLETDLLQMMQVGKPSSLAAAGGVILPFAGGIALGTAMHLPLTTSLFLGAAFTATSVSVSVQVLQEAGRLRTRSGLVIMGAAVADDVLGLLALSLVLSMVGQGSILETLVRLAIFFPASILLGRLVIGPLVKWIARGHTREAGVALIMAIVLFYAWAAESLGGLAAISGAYIAGVIIGRLDEAREWVSDSVSVLGHGLFIPVFFVMVGVSTNITALQSAPFLTIGVIVLAIVTKMLGSGIGARMGGCTWPEAKVVGAGMVARGEVALVVASLGLSSGLITDTTFALVVTMSIATTLVTPLLLRFALVYVSAEALVPNPTTGGGLIPVPIEAEGSSS